MGGRSVWASRSASTRRSSSALTAASAPRVHRRRSLRSRRRSPSTSWRQVPAASANNRSTVALRPRNVLVPADATVTARRPARPAERAADPATIAVPPTRMRSPGSALMTRETGGGRRSSKRCVAPLTERSAAHFDKYEAAVPSAMTANRRRITMVAAALDAPWHRAGARCAPPDWSPMQGPAYGSRGPALLRGSGESSR